MGCYGDGYGIWRCGHYGDIGMLWGYRDVMGIWDMGMWGLWGYRDVMGIWDVGLQDMGALLWGYE